MEERGPISDLTPFHAIVTTSMQTAANMLPHAKGNELTKAKFEMYVNSILATGFSISDNLCQNVIVGGSEGSA